jgi:hypothetical protein
VRERKRLQDRIDWNVTIDAEICAIAADEAKFTHAAAVPPWPDGNKDPGPPLDSIALCAFKHRPGDGFRRSVNIGRLPTEAIKRLPTYQASK